MAAKGSLVLLVLSLASSACRSPVERSQEGQGAAQASGSLAGAGERGRLHFELRLEPPQPAVGEIFRVETVVRAVGGEVQPDGAAFSLDAVMPQHGHGMATRPEHREMQPGHFLSEGMKLHMPGRWQFVAEIDGVDRVVFGYEQRARGR